ncbi:MAG: hypothetical protein HZA12_07775 [Nitrospirae bacterium]|nr:hypothetical protein [Nitrospirota bacterium]
MAVVNCSAINQGEKAIKKIGRIITLSLLGGFGAGISGFLVFVSLTLIREKMAKSLLGPILIQGLCFVPLGACIGLSITYCNKTFQHQRRKIILGSSIGGALYGIFNFFSLEGVWLGLILFCICLAGSIEKVLGLKKQAVKTVFAFLGNFFILFFLVRYMGETGTTIIMSVLDPLRWIGLGGTYNIIWLILVFYFLNFSILAALWGEIGT